jgi:hypothetical protein
MVLWNAVKVPKNMKFRVNIPMVATVMFGAGCWLHAQVPVPPSATTPTAQSPAPASATPSIATTSNTGPIIDGPMIMFDNRDYDFGKAASGEKVKHTYIVTNTGTATLEISDVHPSCGCTTAGGWTHKVEPGQTGEIPVQFDSSRYSSQVTKTITVTSNAKNEPRAVVILHGTVWKPIDVTPSTAVVNVQEDSTNSVSTTVRIISSVDSPIEVTDPTSSSKSFSAELKTVRPGKEYALTISALPPFAGMNTSASISVKTSLPNTPVLSVTAIAAVQQAILVSPMQITLNPSMERWLTNRVFIRGNGGTVLRLQDPEVTDSRLKVDVVPMGMQGMYNVLIDVPPGFDIPQGQRVEVKIRTNDPRHPEIKIPVAQMPGFHRQAGQVLSHP